MSLWPVLACEGHLRIARFSQETCLSTSLSVELPVGYGPSSLETLWGSRLEKVVTSAENMATSTGLLDERIKNAKSEQ